VQPTDHIQIVTFRLAGLEHDAFVAHADAAAPAFRDMPGLREKTWLADPRTSTYGGVYAWESREAMQAYLDGPVFAGLRANPGITDVATHAFDVLPGPTQVTARRAWAAA
jgi:heme-degrading monooxygenase HmoA